MTTDDFRRIALALDGAEQGSHMGQVDFRVGGRIFATLAHADEGLGNLILTPDEQRILVEELPSVFFPIAGGWGRMGMTHVRLGAVDEDVLSGALTTAWRLRVRKNEKGKKPGIPTRPRAAKKSPAKNSPAKKARAKKSPAKKSLGKKARGKKSR